MLSNRSIPSSIVIPVLAYPNVDEAAMCLCRAFGFTVRIRIGSHRIQLNVGDGGAVVLRELRSNETQAMVGQGHSLTIRVDDVDTHCSRARANGVRIIEEPTNHPYGERQYGAIDFAGHEWRFSQSVADVDPEQWGGTAERL